jgi:rhamnosyltransferase subunit B
MRVSITSWGSFGDTFPYVGLALELRARGHHPVLVMPEYYRATVQREDLEFHPLRPEVDPARRDVVGRLMDPKRGPEFLLRGILMGSLRESFEDVSRAARGADLLVAHPLTFAARMVAELEGLPWVSTVLAPMSFFSRYDLPVPPQAPWAKRLERVPGLAAALLRLGRLVTSGWSAPVIELRRELGLPPGGDPLYEGQHSPHLVLALFSSVLADPQADWPPNVRITGAVAYNGPRAGSEISSEVAAFLENGPPPVVFTLGSSAVGAAGDFYVHSVKAVRSLGCRAVLLVGSHPENRPGRVPGGVILAEFAPHAALFPRASAIVHQGGAGTLHQALLSGIPTIVVPFAFDQADNAYRVERLGVSRTIPAARYDVARLRRELQTLFADPAFHSRAGAVADRVRGENGAGAAVDAIEQCFLGRGATERRDAKAAAAPSP